MCDHCRYIYPFSPSPIFANRNIIRSHIFSRTYKSMLKEGDNGKTCYQMEMSKPISMQPITMQPISMQPISMQPMASTKQTWDSLSLSPLSLSLRLSSNFNGVKRAIGGEIAGFRLTNRIYNLQQESGRRFDGLLLLEEDLLRRDVLQARRQLLRHRTGASSGRKTDAYLPNLSHLSSHPTNTDASALSARRLSLSLRWSGS